MPTLQRLSLTCSGLVTGGDPAKPRDLKLDGLLVDGAWSCGLARITNFSGALHRIESLVLAQTDAAWTVDLRLVIQPDPWFPPDLRPQVVDLHLRGEGGCGTWGGRGDLLAAGGAATMNLAAAEPDAPADGRLRLTAIRPRHGESDQPFLTLCLDLAGGVVRRAWVGASFQGDAGLGREAEVLPTRGAANRIGCRLRCDLVDLAGLAESDGPWLIDVQAECLGDEAVASVALVGETGGRAVEACAWGRLLRGPAAAAPLPIEDQDAPWWTPVPGFTTPPPGEHPRLLMRPGDLPALRAKAATPIGRAILGRLRRILGADGEALPAVRNQNPTVGQGAKGPATLPIGAFTAWHPAGYAALHAATGEARYADLARQALELLWSGVPDRDERYAWAKVGGLRIGPVLEGVALAYDLCYHAWSEEFRAEVRRRLLTYDDPHCERRRTLEHLLDANRYPPGSNHYGAYIGGPGLVALALRGDPGVDDRRISRLLAMAETGAVRTLRFGFGDHGGFAEGHHPSRLSANSGLVGFLRACRSAAGQDWRTPRPHATHLTLRWIHLLSSWEGRPAFLHHGVYGHDDYDCWGLSHGGEFATGFGNTEPRFHGALLWTWRTFIAGRQHVPARADWLDEGEDSFDVLTYPHRALYALIDWPVDLAPQNPAEVLPRVLIDRAHHHLVARNRWQDGDDILVSFSGGGGAKGYYRASQGTPSLRVQGLGLRSSLPLGERRDGRLVHCSARDDGSFDLEVDDAGRRWAVACDFSQRSGCPVAILALGDLEAGEPPVERSTGARGALRTWRGVLGGRPAFLLLLHEGAAPAITSADDRLEVGGRTWRVEAGRLV